MKRNVSLDEISDGKLYETNDMVKADCGDCRGCSACCRGMGQSILLDPLDVHRLWMGIRKEKDVYDFSSMLSVMELHVVDGIILPNLKMTGQDEKCSFLSPEGRCSIHSHRPGICRIFPLGRYYEEGGFRYFLQVHECKNDRRTKVKVKKWIDTPDVKRYEEYIINWHNLLKEMEELVESTDSDEKIKEINMQLLNVFFVTPYSDEKDFYEQFYERLSMIQSNYLR